MHLHAQTVNRERTAHCRLLRLDSQSLAQVRQSLSKHKSDTDYVVIYLTANNDVVAARVNSHACDASRPTNQLLCQSLLGQVVHSDMVLCGHEEEGLDRVEQHPHHSTPVLSEGVLCGVLGQLVDQYCLGVACTVTCTIHTHIHTCTG